MKRTLALLTVAIILTGCTHLGPHARGLRVLYAPPFPDGVRRTSEISGVGVRKAGPFEDGQVSVLSGRGKSDVEPEVVAGGDGFLYVREGVAELLKQRPLTFEQTRYNTDGSSQTLRLVEGDDSRQSRGALGDFWSFAGGVIFGWLTGAGA